MNHRDYPNPADWEHASPRQRDRALRSFEHLGQHNVPAYRGPLFVEDDELIETQNGPNAARRLLVLWAVELRAEGVPRDEVIEIIEQNSLWVHVSPNEKQFLGESEPDADLCRKLVWRLESIWVLLWALGYIDALDWPYSMCDVTQLVRIVEPFESDATFISNANLRPKSELLDAQDLIMRINWAIRDSNLHGDGLIPENLSWSDDAEYVEVSQSAAAGVVYERHHTLNWLTKFLDPANWDEVDTPT